ncbi:MAG: FecR domain-containing protein [Gammaproteobacteria bacterium]|nr:FecR domain-containing protein [Gammaproteobacteria bacterium]
MNTKSLVLLGASLLIISATNPSLAQTCENIAGRITSIQGRISVQRTDSSDWQRAALNETVCEGDTVRASSRSRAAVNLINQTVLRLDQSSSIRVDTISPKAEVSSLLRLFSGVIQFFSRKPRTFDVQTTTSTIGIRGTEFVLSAREGEPPEVTVLEGELLATNEAGEATIGSGQTAVLAEGVAPQVRTVVRPRDQVQWSLFYPPIIALSSLSSATADTDATLGQARDCARSGDTECAFEALENTPQSARSADYFLLRAALLLSVGRVDDARTAIDSALTADAQTGSALALRAVIAVVQNDAAQALEDARQAVTLSPDAAAPRIALSYAQQADLQLEAARDTLLEAVERQPEDALAWARLAELWLALGFRSEGADAAQRATEIDPDVSRTHIVQGFAALARIDTDGAAQAFESALALDSADPLAHLGLGLARIRDGRLAEGRSNIETAVAVDSNNALLRPYLGRAYFEERRAPLDAEQYAIAKELDPLDPTAYLFDALRKQSENRPVDALYDLETSIANNDNRAVYRSRNLLDQDRAARGVSLAKVYDTLGFTQLGLNESRRSLTLDPSNASAHRFLSDSYGSVRRHEISRVSELLQAQMLQDINTNPVQPSLSASNLNVAGGGPADVGLNEFTPLFESDGLHLGATALGGNNDTKGGEVVVSALYDRFSVSLGGYTYETDGWRENNFQEHDIGNLFLQAAITPELNAQIELGKRDTKEGDLAFRFDPQDFSESKKVQNDLETQRLGLRWSPGASNDFLISYMESDRERSTFEDGLFPILVFPDPPAPPIPELVLVPATFDDFVAEDGTQAELQYIRRGGSYSVVAGANSSETDRKSTTAITVQGFPPIEDPPAERTIDHERAYLYTNFALNDAVTLTLGASTEEYKDDPHDEKDDNAKLGLQWQINQTHALRLAAFQSTKPPLVNNRTLEPTQVAGFNQFFDDINGTKSETVGFGYDSMPVASFSWGIELTERKMEEPTIVVIRDFVTDEVISRDSVFEDREERLGKLYVYWTPHPSVAVSAEAIGDEYEAAQGIVTGTGGLPTDVTTYSLPIGTMYYSPGGWFTGIKATYVDQEVKTALEGPSGPEPMTVDDQFTVVDLVAGYRFPKRYGAITAEVRNVGDEQFNYLDDSYREFRDEPATGPYFPETTGIIRATFTF